ncbi:hypothetical protein IQ230_01060 [Gloeocapsopsis crepidinum LEGE 06123]|uniref:Plastid lipid-associated protein/fibrillin conserved domain-containing protein n=1 Tax=Gloeocapsopsis crepidinum LEGE 06123 TaxID=588587 RepID=A0ABR9UL13_9CHRO|nr:hypothetical protein [Gloeocapsopsis crepidinum]MBE9188977.1 hypothetical protein [Gloeocapsopsis crepidinum LEGE 06123]
MSTDLAATEVPDFMTTLTDAVRKKRDRPSASSVILALLQAEKTAKQQRITYPLEPLIGDWRLWFTAPRTHLQKGKVLGKGLYVPQFAPARISFFGEEQLLISNQIQLGSLRFKLTGSAQYFSKKNLLAFDFNRMQLYLFNRAIYDGNRSKNMASSFNEKPIAKLPFFAFFLVNEDFIAARGRGGGIALWVRN